MKNWKLKKIKNNNYDANETNNKSIDYDKNNKNNNK